MAATAAAISERSALSIRNADGNTVTDMRYEGHRIYAGKPSIDPLPAVYLNSESEADTLEIDMADKVIRHARHAHIHGFSTLSMLSYAAQESRMRHRDPRTLTAR